MYYPTIPVLNTSRDMVDVFGGYNHNLRIGEGEFYDMKNMCSDHYPLLSPRKKRGVYAEGVSGGCLLSKDGLCYVDGSDFVINDYHVNLGLSTAAQSLPKRLVSMGAYVIILPDKVWINTLDLTQHGSIEASYSTDTTFSDVTFSLCKADGESYEDTVISDTEPADPENAALWIDTSSAPHSLKQYSASSGVWNSIATTYVRISATGIGAAFAQYDGVNIDGILAEDLQDLNGSHVIWAKGTHYIVVTGMLDTVRTQLYSDGTITVKRKMPEMDFVIEANNRLWGCRYGVADNGEVVNEIYASKLGDFKNWNCFMGISTDSWVGSCGSDGQFTGAITHLGYPLFFKENCLHKVYISATGAHQIQDTVCRGVQKGSAGSLAIVNEVLYYKARHAVCAYDGAYPTEVSAALGDVHYIQAVGGGHGNKYYISMLDGDGGSHLFVYDTGKGLWHREDDLRAAAFCSCDAQMYCLEEGTGRILDLFGSGRQESDDVEWMVQTGIIGTDMPDRKYIYRLLIRMALSLGSRVHIYAQYDSVGDWEPLGVVNGTRLCSAMIPVRPRRCDHLQLRIEGRGDVRIFSITKTTKQGSDLA